VFDGYDLPAWDRALERRFVVEPAEAAVVRRVFDTPEGYEELRASLAELWRLGEEAWTPGMSTSRRPRRSTRWS